MVSMWWTPRRKGERTNLYLSRVLRAVRLDDMARRAELYHFDDFFCPEPVDDGMNMQRLVAELRREADKMTPVRRREVNAIVQAVIQGEFDSTKEESEEYSRSARGQADMAELLRRERG